MINAYKSGTIVILYLQIIEKEGHPYQNENVAAVLPQYCRNIDLLPEIPGSKSCNIATIAAIII